MIDYSFVLELADGFVKSAHLIFYATFFLSLTIITSQFLFSRNFIVLACLAGFFIFRIVLSITVPINPFIPEFSDVILFTEIIEEGSGAEGHSMGVNGFFYVTYFINILLLNDVNHFVFFQQFLYYLAMFLLFSCFSKECKNELNNKKEIKILYLFLITIYPASIIFTVVPLRETFAMLGVALFCIGLKGIKEKRGFISFAVGVILLVLIRPQLVPVMILGAYTVYYYGKWRFYFYSIFAVLASFFAFQIFIYEITPQILSSIRSAWAQMHGIEVYGVFEWNTWLDVVMSFPSLFIQYLTSPLPVLHSKPMANMLMYSLDFLFLMPLYLMVVFYMLFSKEKLHKIRFSILFIVFMVLTVLSSIWEGYIGGAVRHRLISIICIMPLYSYLLVSFSSDLANFIARNNSKKPHGEK